jgi:predicted O-methyltransferase YrrM
VRPKSWWLDEDLHDYLVAHGTPPDEHLSELAGETLQLGDVARMQVAPEQGAFLTLLTELVDARLAIELGTFTGYSALCIARGLAPGGRLLCCDVSEEWTAIARRHWQKAGVDDRIELRIGPAIDTLRDLGADAEIDLAFVDADEQGYVAYFAELVPRLRPGGLLLADNVLWSGRVADPSATDEETVALRAFNDMVAADPRVKAVMLPIADGLTLARKR